eukprot:2178260-Amphidinium_carterae.1
MECVRAGVSAQSLVCWCWRARKTERAARPTRPNKVELTKSALPTNLAAWEGDKMPRSSTPCSSRLSCSIRAGLA